AHPEALDGEQLAGAAPSPIGRERPPLREQPFVRDGVAEAPERSPAVDRPQQRLAQPGLLLVGEVRHVLPAVAGARGLDPQPAIGIGVHVDGVLVPHLGRIGELTGDRVPGGEVQVPAGAHHGVRIEQGDDRVEADGHRTTGRRLIAQQRQQILGELPVPSCVAPQNGAGSGGRAPSTSSGSIDASATTQQWVQSSPWSKVYWNTSPDSTVRATFAVPMSNGSANGASGEAASSPPSSGSVTTRPSARVNMDRCARSQRAKATSMAPASWAKVWEGPT